MNLNILKGLNKNTSQPIQPEPQVVQQPVQAQPQPQAVQQPVQAQPQPQVVQQPVMQIDPSVFNQPESQTQLTVEQCNSAYLDKHPRKIIGYDLNHNPIYEKEQELPHKEGYILKGYDLSGQPIYEKDPNYVPPRKIIGYDLNHNPIYEEPKKIVPLTEPLSMITRELSQEELSQHIIETLSLTTTNVDVFEVPHASVQPKVLDVKDTKGLIAEKLERAEKLTGLSVIPFKVAGITKFVKEIMGYDIFEVDGEKYATSREHKVSSQRIDELCELIDKTITSGEIVNESVMMEYKDKGISYNVCKFNKYEMGYIEALYKNYRAVFYTMDNDVYIAVGV